MGAVFAEGVGGPLNAVAKVQGMGLALRGGDPAGGLGGAVAEVDGDSGKLRREPGDVDGLKLLRGHVKQLEARIQELEAGCWLACCSMVWREARMSSKGSSFLNGSSAVGICECKEVMHSPSTPL